MHSSAICPSSLLGVLRAPHPLCCMCFSVPCLLISFFFVCVWGAGHRSVQVGHQSVCWFIPGVAMGIPRVACLFTCWSASPKQVWNWHLVAQKPSCFLSVTWYGETLYRLGVQGLGVLLLLGGFFCQVWLQHLSKIFDFRSSSCLLPPSSHHLGSDDLQSFLAPILFPVAII
jgi:hypothetical protein